MRRMMILIFLIALLISGQAQAGNFNQSCTDLDLVQDSILKAWCRTNSPLIGRSTGINLYGLIKNDNGSLSWINSSNSILPSAFQSCNAMKLDYAVHGYAGLDANCPDNHGNFKRTNINLNERITNSDGDLKFDQ